MSFGRSVSVSVMLLSAAVTESCNPSEIICRVSMPHLMIRGLMTRSHHMLADINSFIICADQLLSSVTLDL